jgi:enterochelin esterase family protein
MDPAARTEYKIVVDGKWILDPRNPEKIGNGIDSENSVAAMPGYAASKWAATTGPLPELKELEVESQIYGKRKVRVYLPPGYENSATRFPVMYVQDGSQYFDAAKATVQQENLVRAGRLKPFVMVFLDPGDRMKEYWASDDYARFLAEEVVPAVDSAFRTVRDRSGRAVWGASLGGVTAIHAGLKYPAVFMRIGGQSSSFWVDDERVTRALAASDLPPMKFYLDDGTLEGTEDSRRAALVAASAGHTVRFIEAQAGHNWTAWRDRLADGFVALMD